MARVHRSTASAGDRLARRRDDGGGVVAGLVKTQNKLLDEYAARIEPIALQLKDAKMDAAAGLAYAVQAAETVDALQKNLAELLAAQRADATALRDEMAGGARTAGKATVAMASAGIVLVLPLMVLTLRSICTPLYAAVRLAQPHRRGPSRRRDRYTRG
jgi:hypothetical protein